MSQYKMDTNIKIPEKKPKNLIFTEYILFFVFAIALLLVTSKPIFGVQLSNTPLKHIPLILFLTAFTIHLMGRFIVGSFPLNIKGIGYWVWPFFILGLYVTVGSLVANFLLNVKENFLILGAYLMLTPLFFIWGREEDSSIKIIKPLVLLWGVAALFSLLGAVIRFGKVEALHEIEFLVLPFFLYMYFAFRSLGMKVFSLVLLVLVSILTQKLTGYVIGLAAFIYIFITYVKNVVSPKWKGFIFTLTIVLLVLFVGTLIIGFIYFREYFPTGNAVVRLHQYEIAYQDFLDSPIWGKAYTASSGTVYQENLRSLNVPTHSDILDLLKQGGAIAFILWAVGIFKAIKLFMQSTKKDLNDLKVTAFFHAMTFMSIAAVFSYTFNPLLLKPPFAFVIWGMLSLAIAVASSKKGKLIDS